MKNGACGADGPAVIGVKRKGGKLSQHRSGSLGISLKIKELVEVASINTDRLPKLYKWQLSSRE